MLIELEYELRKTLSNLESLTRNTHSILQFNEVPMNVSELQTAYECVRSFREGLAQTDEFKKEHEERYI